MQVISINGCDGVGKSEQVNLLKADDRFHFTGNLANYDNRWPKLSPVESFNWWFLDLPFVELVSIILASLAGRRATYKCDKININDRGSSMFKAVCATTLTTRELATFEESVRVVDELFKEEVQDCEYEQNILLKSDPGYATKIGHLIQVSGVRDNKYLPWQNKMYAQYQLKLAYFMDYYYQRINPANVVCVDSCILDTHNKLRTVINKICAIDLQPICSNISKLVAFGGMSESGKSSFAERLSICHQFYRLKIKYFGGVVSGRGLEVNPITLGREFLDFFQSHKHITQASIESLHSAGLPAYLKLLFGPRMKVVYLDTPEDIRVRRTAQELGISHEDARMNTVAKDSTKLSCGADKVKNIADIVFNNECDDFVSAFQTFFSQI